MKYVVLGASAAGISGARRLRELDQEAEIVLISTDERIYSRCILHHYVDGERDLDQLMFVTLNFIEIRIFEPFFLDNCLKYVNNLFRMVLFVNTSM